jgi:hypothetical protein
VDVVTGLVAGGPPGLLDVTRQEHLYNAGEKARPLRWEVLSAPLLVSVDKSPIDV